MPSSWSLVCAASSGGIVGIVMRRTNKEVLLGGDECGAVNVHYRVAPMDVLVTVMNIEFFDTAGDSGGDGLHATGVIVYLAQCIDGDRLAGGL